MRCHPVRVIKNVLQLLLLLLLLLLLVIDVPLPEVRPRNDAVRREFQRLQVELSPMEIQMDGSLANETTPQRLERMRKVCDTSPDFKQEQKRGPINQNLLVDVIFKTLTCTPAKASSTDWKFLMIKLHMFRYIRPMRWQKIHKSQTLNEVNITYLQEHPQATRDKIMNTYYKYVVVRHPWLRLVAGYQERFESLTPEALEQDPLVKEIKNKFDPLQESGTSGVLFHEYIQYVLSMSGSPADMDRKWMPIRYACEPCLVKYDFIVKLENLDLDMMALLFSMNVTGHKLPYFGSIVKQDAPVSQIMNYFRKVSESDYLQLTQFYRGDFELFGYLVPPRPTELPINGKAEVDEPR